MRSYGLTGLKAHVRKTIAFGNTFADLVRTRSDLFDILTQPAFCLTVLRVKNPRRASVANNGAMTNGSGSARVAAVDETANAITKEAYELVNRRGEIFITSTMIAGHYAIRVVSANPAAEEKYIRNAFNILVKTAEEVRQKHG